MTFTKIAVKKSKKSSSMNTENSDLQSAIENIYYDIYNADSCFEPVIKNIPPFKLPTILDILKDSIGKVKKVDIKGNQTELLWSICYALNEITNIGNKILSKLGTQYQTNLFVSPSGEIPKISITDYMIRLVKFSPCSRECFIMIIVYLDRIISSGNFIVNSFNIHRLLITSIMIASKYIDDRFYNNLYYSHIGGITRNELNLLEIAYLNLIKFDLSCNLNDYINYYSQLESFVPQIRYMKSQMKIQLKNQSQWNNSPSAAECASQIQNFKSYTIVLPLPNSNQKLSSNSLFEGCNSTPAPTTTTINVSNCPMSPKSRYVPDGHHYSSSNAMMNGNNQRMISTTNDETVVPNQNTIVYSQHQFNQPISASSSSSFNFNQAPQQQPHQQQKIMTTPRSNSFDSQTSSIIVSNRRNSLLANNNNQFFALPKSSSTTCISS